MHTYFCCRPRLIKYRFSVCVFSVYTAFTQHFFCCVFKSFHLDSVFKLKMFSCVFRFSCKETNIQKEKFAFSLKNASVYETGPNRLVLKKFAFSLQNTAVYETGPNWLVETSNSCWISRKYMLPLCTGTEGTQFISIRLRGVGGWDRANTNTVQFF